MQGQREDDADKGGRGMNADGQRTRPGRKRDRNKVKQSRETDEIC